MSTWISSVASLAGVDVTSPVGMMSPMSKGAAGSGTLNGGGFRKSFASQYQGGGRSGRSSQYTAPGITEVCSDDDDVDDDLGATRTTPTSSEPMRMTSPSSSTAMRRASFASVSSGRRDNTKDGSSNRTTTLSPTTTSLVQQQQQQVAQPQRTSSMYGRSGSRPLSNLPLGPLIYQPLNQTQQQQEDSTQQMRPSTSPVTDGMMMSSSEVQNTMQGNSQFPDLAPGARDNTTMSQVSGSGRSGTFYNFSRSHVPPLALTAVGTGAIVGLQQLGEGGRGPGSARSSLQSATNSVARPRRPCANILVLGSRQVGKSAFVNAYRAVNTASAKWPVAPVGMCGRHGTTAVDPCPNNSLSPSWIFVDTPGRVYSELHRRAGSPSQGGSTMPPSSTKIEEGNPAGPSSGTSLQNVNLDPISTSEAATPSMGGGTNGENYDGDDSLLLQMLFEGLPWKTRLVGPQSSSLSTLSNLPPTPRNKVHHAVVVLSATDILTPAGGSSFGSWLGLTYKFINAPQLDSLRSHLADFLEYLRVLLGDRAPFIIITHMDMFSSRWRATAEKRIKEELKSCVPLNRVYFMSLPSAATARSPVSESSPGTLSAGGAPLTLAKHMEGVAPSDAGTKTQLLRLHHDLQSELAWSFQTVLNQQQEANDLQQEGSESFAMQRAPSGTLGLLK